MEKGKSAEPPVTLSYKIVFSLRKKMKYDNMIKNKRIGKGCEFHYGDLFESGKYRVSGVHSIYHLYR